MNKLTKPKRAENKTMSLSPLVNPECAVSGIAATLGKDNASALRSICGNLDSILFIFLCTGLVGIFIAIDAPKVIKYVPVWLALGYALLYVPLRVAGENASDKAFQMSGLGKGEWLSAVAADSRTRLTVAASLTAAIIVSANAWISRWEASRAKAIGVGDAPPVDE